MAVVLFRSAQEKALNLSSPEHTKLPSIVVENKPISTGDSHVGKRISSRCAWEYGCEEPRREEVWRGSYDRRKVQLTSCGFYGPPYKPYRDLGGVALDDQQLILDGLGQRKQPEKELSIATPSTAVSVAKVTGPPIYRQLRAKTPSQYPTELIALGTRVKEGEGQLDVIRKGRGLFRLLAESEQYQKAEEDRQREAELEGQRSDWQQALVEETHSATSLELGAMIASPSLQHQTLQSASSSQASLGEASSQLPHTEQETAILVEQWYQQLCVLLWVLQAMCLEHAEHMYPLSQCWRVSELQPNELAGQRHHELQRQLLSKWEQTIRQPSIQMHARRRWGTGTWKVSTVRKISKMWTPTPPVAATPPAAALKRQAQGTSSGVLHTATTGGNGSPKPHVSTEQKAGGVKDPRPGVPRKKKLTPLEMEALITMLEEQLNWSKKQSRSRMDAILKQTDQVTVPSRLHKKLKMPKISLDIAQVERQFADTEDELDMVVHEQLSAMDRERAKALKQRFSLLKISGNKERDLASMREGVEIETTTMAKRKLLMNYNWFEELMSLLPLAVKEERYCCQRLAKLKEMAAHMACVGPEKMSKRKLVSVLSRLRPWELENPPIKAAVKFLTERVIYVVREDYEHWLNQHTLTHTAKLKH